MKLSKILADYRKEHKLSYREFSKISGISHNHLRRMEIEDITNPNINVLAKLASAMGYSINDFFMMLDDDTLVKIPEHEPTLDSVFLSIIDTMNESEKQELINYARYIVSKRGTK